jgi:RNA recognition motif-containing protein
MVEFPCSLAIVAGKFLSVSRTSLVLVLSKLIREPHMLGECPMKIFVGNMSFKTTEDGLRAAFEAHGEVGEVAVVTDRETGRPRGFGFVTMTNDDQARQAIDALNGTELDGRAINVNEARPKPAGSGGGRGGYGGGGRGGNGGGRGGW